MNVSPPNITSLQLGEIFVFGSNEAGKHGAGAAKLALFKFGAVYGQGYGLQGKSFGIPTKDSQIKTLPIPTIEEYVIRFLDFALAHQDYKFLVTKIGTGLAGLELEDIAPLFKRGTKLNNVYLPLDFLHFYSDNRFADKVVKIKT